MITPQCDVLAVDVLPAGTRDAAVAAGEDIRRALQIARDLGADLALPASGATAARWSALTALARANLTVARVVEAHTDALAVLAEAGLDPATSSVDGASRRTWGVFAAEAPGVRLDATAEPDPTGGADRFVLTGVKPWCSLGAVLDAALVTAHTAGGRRLFAVDLQHPTVRADPPATWVARGLRTVTSGPVTFAATPATPVGADGWYLQRPGFAWGGIGVAACWHGGALGLADTLHARLAGREAELGAMHLGAVDVALHGSATALQHAAARVDAGALSGAAAGLLAARTRAVVADAAERVLHQVGHALGPSPLAFDAEHAARVADLTLYVRQHHGERDLAALGHDLQAGSA